MAVPLSSSPAPAENILSKSPSWWQVIIAFVGLTALAMGRVTDDEVRLHVTEYQSQICIADRSSIHAEVAALKTEYQTDMRAVSDKLTRVETILQEMRQHQR